MINQLNLRNKKRLPNLYSLPKYIGGAISITPVIVINQVIVTNNSTVPINYSYSSGNSGSFNINTSYTSSFTSNSDILYFSNAGSVKITGSSESFYIQGSGVNQVLVNSTSSTNITILDYPVFFYNQHNFSVELQVYDSSHTLRSRTNVTASSYIQAPKVLATDYIAVSNPNTGSAKFYDVYEGNYIGETDGTSGSISWDNTFSNKSVTSGSFIDNTNDATVFIAVTRVGISLIDTPTPGI